jgi:hypothetical protein
MTNLIRRAAVASLLVRGEAWKQPAALRRLTERPAGSPAWVRRNAGTAKRSTRRDLPVWVRAAGVRAFIVAEPHERRKGGKQTAVREGRQEVGVCEVRNGATSRLGSAREGYARSRSPPSRSVVVDGSNDLDRAHGVGAGQRRQRRQVVRPDGQGRPTDHPGGGVAASRPHHGAAGVDGQSIERFAAQAERYLQELRISLKNGGYRPHPVKRVEIPKGDGRTRPLGIPTIKSLPQANAGDRIVQTALKSSSSRSPGSGLWPARGHARNAVPAGQLRLPPGTQLQGRAAGWALLIQQKGRSRNRMAAPDSGHRSRNFYLTSVADFSACTYRATDRSPRSAPAVSFVERHHK